MIFVRALVIENGQWTIKELINDPISSYSNYSDIRIKVKETEDSQVVDIRKDELSRLVALEVDSNITFSDFIVNLDAESVTTDEETLLGQVDMVVMRDLWDYPGTVMLGNANYGIGSVIPVNQDIDVVFENDLDPLAPESATSLFKNCLFAVDGIICPTSLVDGRLFIHRAGRKLKSNKGGTISVIDFSQLGGVTIHHVKEDDINVRLRTIEGDSTRSYRTDCGIEIDDDLNGKSFFIVAAGFFRYADASVGRLTEKAVKLSLRHAREVDNIFKRPTSERSGYINTIFNPDTIDIYTLDAKRLLSQGDTFVITVDRKDLITKTEPFYTTGLPGNYSISRIPNGMAFRDDGRLVPYKINEVLPDEVTVSTIDNRRMEFISSKSGDVNAHVRTSATEPLSIDNLDGAILFDIYGVD